MVARKYGISVNELKKWNNLRSSKLKRGQRLKVSSPYKEQVKDVITASGGTTSTEVKIDAVPAENANKETTSETPKDETTVVKEVPKKNSSKETGVKYYKVRSGDTLWKIATSHGMTLAEIRKLNGFSTKSKITPGQKVKVK